jgi:hypothetical protein
VVMLLRATAEEMVWLRGSNLVGAF